MLFPLVQADKSYRLVFRNDRAVYCIDLWQKVQMPGKRILIDTTAWNIDIDLLKTFKDKQGIDPNKIFEFGMVATVPELK